MIEVAFARTARELLESGGIDVEYHESDAAHHIEPAHIPPAITWLSRLVAPSVTDARA